MKYNLLHFPVYLICFCLFSLKHYQAVSASFVHDCHLPVGAPMHVRVRGRTAIFATNDQGDMETPKKNKKGYQFGDITKNLVSKVTKKDD
jgi:hypothetical protein